MASYKLATYRSADGPRAGVVVDDKLFDAEQLSGEAAYATVLGVLDDWEAAERRLAQVAATATETRAAATPRATAAAARMSPTPPHSRRTGSRTRVSTVPARSVPGSCPQATSRTRRTSP